MSPRIVNPYEAEKISNSLQSRLRLLILELTQNCNLACAYCIDGDAYQQKNCMTRQNMRRRDAFRAVDLLFERSSEQKNPLSISFYGGEPLLRFHLLRDVVAYARKRGEVEERQLVFGMTTNGTLFDERIIDFLADNEVHCLISLDGTATIHDSFRRSRKGEATFNKVMAGLDLIRLRRPEYYQRFIQISVVVMPTADLDALQVFFDALDLPMKANFVESYGLDLENGAAKIDVGSIAAGLRTRMQENGPDYIESARSDRDFAACLLRSLIGRMQGDGKSVECGLGQCIPGVSRLLMAADGWFYPCEKLAGHSFARIGHIGSKKALLEEERVNRLVQDFYDLAERKCDGCWLAPRCSMCLALCVSGDLVSEDKFDYCCRGQRAGGNFGVEFLRATGIGG
nr:radical SAM protein [uncultured Cohaesibacter sp.]